MLQPIPAPRKPHACPKVDQVGMVWVGVCKLSLQDPPLALAGPSFTPTSQGWLPPGHDWFSGSPQMLLPAGNPICLLQDPSATTPSEYPQAADTCCCAQVLLLTNTGPTLPN